MRSPLLDAADYRRSPATMPRYHDGRTPRNMGLRYQADPPTSQKIVSVTRAASDGPDGARVRTLIVIRQSIDRQIKRGGMPCPSLPTVSASW